MGVRGRRIVQDINEPTLLGNIDDIISEAQKNGFVTDCSVNIEAILNRYNIEIKRVDMPPAKSGYLKKIENHWIIGVNRNHHPHRQRFTMAHEFAHYILHRDDNNFFEDEIFYRDENQTSIEFAANAFASKLLMPDDLIKMIIAGGVKSLKELALRFDVSTLAVKNRVISLGYKVINDEE